MTFSFLLTLSLAAPAFTPDVEFVIRLTSRISSSATAVGDPFTADVSKDVKTKQGNILFPKGAKVAGRVTRIEKPSPKLTMWLLTMKLESITIDGQQQPLVAGLASPLEITGLASGSDLPSMNRNSVSSVEQGEIPSNIRGRFETNQIVIYKEKFDLKPGFSMTWRTQ